MSSRRFLLPLSFSQCTPFRHSIISLLSSIPALLRLVAHAFAPTPRVVETSVGRLSCHDLEQPHNTHNQHMHSYTRKTMQPSRLLPSRLVTPTNRDAVRWSLIPAQPTIFSLTQLSAASLVTSRAALTLVAIVHHQSFPTPLICLLPHRLARHSPYVLGL